METRGRMDGGKRTQGPSQANYPQDQPKLGESMVLLREKLDLWLNLKNLRTNQTVEFVEMGPQNRVPHPKIP